MIKTLLLLIVALVIGAAAGGYFGGALGGKGGAVLGMCEMSKVAINQGYLDRDQVLALAEATGKEMQTNSPSIAKHLSMSENVRNTAAPASDCSQILVHMNRGMDAAK